MIRRDWTEPLSKGNLLDLSNNVCYDRYINHSYEYDAINYPDDSIAYHELSRYYNVNPKNIAIGYGSCELVLRILSTYRNTSISIARPTWQLAEMYAAGLKMNIVEEGDIHYVANPNGITGQALTRQEILNLADKHQMVIVDEAYGDFSNCSVLDIAPSLPNVIVVKTFSKSIASPGLRFGYCFSNDVIIKRLQDSRPGYVTTGQTASAVKHLLPQIKLHVARMLDTKEYIEGKYDVIPSLGNYVLFNSNPRLPVKMKEINGVYRMALTDIVTFKELENEYY